MSKVAITVLTSSAVFFVLMLGFDLIFRDAAMNGETIMANVFKTLIFAMAFGALKVGMILFRSEDK